MNVKSQQVEQPQQTSQEAETGRNRVPGQHKGRVTIAVVTIAIGAALTALVLGVTGGTETDAPPSPGVTRPYGNDLAPTGLDQRLHELAPQKLAVPPTGIDQRLHELAE